MRWPRGVDGAKAAVVLALAAAAGAPVGAGAATRAALQRPAAAELLDLYERGEYDAVRQIFVTSQAVDGLRTDLERSGLNWTNAAGPAAAPRRRVAAATMALELAHARLEDEWRTLRSLVEWGCDLLRRGPPTEAERTWQLAALALSQGALDSGVLFRVSGAAKSYGHLDHARRRFPDEPRFVLAERFAVYQPLVAEPSLHAGVEPDADRTTPDGTARADAQARTRRDTAGRQLREVFDDPVIGAEAALRAGHLQLIGLDLDAALEAFHVARRSSTSPYVKYLAHFFRGRVLERMGRPDEAERAYAAAADTVPLAQSAALARAALLMRAGRTADAHALTTASFSAQPRPPDPWRLFPYADFYRWPGLVAELRRELAR